MVISSTGKLDSINETVKVLSQRVGALKEGIEKKLDLINQSNAALSTQVQSISQRLTTLENQGTITVGCSRSHLSMIYNIFTFTCT